ncbi:DUF1292 domain-containing protein [Evansella sp. LMS18]|uniref:DUF1292 domain-containing protein n=1 Tax=Evansella sp. LMS18 TaxID=2924033 RepID=UPI0020D08B17|nr:DUF1292 domain-containing protein [Evansella sp. LMS18]UTR10395.1 DUF1292 domain-containing protein [Evansella sp. LMS18]
MEKLEVGEVFTISDDNDEEQEVEVLAKMSMDGHEYVAVSFVEDLHEEEEDSDSEGIDVFFLKADEDGGLSAIESDDEFDKVSAGFDELLDDAEDADNE